MIGLRLFMEIYELTEIIILRVLCQILFLIFILYNFFDRMKMANYTTQAKDLKN